MQVFLKQHTKYVFIAVCLFLITSSILLRSVEVLNKNYVFGYDQGRDYESVKTIVIDHKLTLIGSASGGGFSGFQGIFHGPFYLYLLVIPFILFNGDPYGGILFMFLFGIGSIVLGYSIGEKIFGRLGGLITATLLAVSPTLISQSRMVWAPNPATVFILGALWSVYAVRFSSPSSIFLTGFLAGFLYNFEIPFAVPICIALLIYFFLIYKIRSIRQYIWLLGGILTALLPMIVFSLRHGIRFYQSFIIASSGIGPIVLDFFKERKFLPSIFLSNFSHSFPVHSMIPDSVLLMGLVITTYFFVVKETDVRRKKYVLFLVLLPIVSFLLYFVLGIPVYEHYLGVLTLCYIFITAYTILSLRKYIKIVPISIALIVLLGPIILIINGFIRNFQKDYVDYGGGAKIRGKLDAIDYIYSDANGKPFGLYIFTPPVYTYAYDYLLWWYAEKKYHFVPKEEKNGIFYLLIEPDWEKPWSYNGWLETVIKEGDVIETRELPSGLIVQKRVASNHETN